uniref:Uncharacterized protein n=1 Tax=Avena sativa TaxID=4498 RepID=A0ACD5V6K3_AVESA
MAKRRRADDNVDDRLSDLPDCLLHDILSNLKARQLVQTCVLSSRWRRLWLTAPCLDIDAGEFASVASRQDKVRFKPLFGGKDGEEEEEDEELDRFDDFVDSLLLRRSGCVSPLGTLRLSMPSAWSIWMRFHFDRRGSNSHTRWVRRGLRCSPATLDVSGIKLPPLTSGTHRLTKLRLYNVRLHKDFETHLSSGLPVLEDLEVRCTEMSKISRIASHTLKNLTVDNSPTTNEGTSLKFAVDAPRLSRLHLAVQFKRLGVFAVTLSETTSPVHASICFLDKAKLRQVQGGCYYWQDDKNLLLALCKLLRSLSQTVTSLELSGFQDMAVGEQHIPNFPSPGTPWPAGAYQSQQTVQTSADSLPRPMLQAILDAEHNRSPLFPNLKTLVIDKCQIGDNIQTFWSLLQHTPALEKLTLNNCECEKFRYGAASYTLDKGGTASSLKLVEIIYKDGDDHEGQDTPQMEKILSMVQRDLPVTTKIHVSKLQK